MNALWNLINNKKIYSRLLLVILVLDFFAIRFDLILCKEIREQKQAEKRHAEKVKKSKMAEIRMEPLIADIKSTTVRPKKIKRFILTKNPTIDNGSADKLAKSFVNKCKKNKQLPGPAIAVAMAFVESQYDPNAVSPKNAVGLMQVRPAVWSDDLIKQGLIINEDDLFEADLNLKAGWYIFMKYYQEQLIRQKNGEITDALYWALYLYSGKSKNYPYKVKKALKELLAT